jgi:nifR3 family TIM-barrel protein
VNFWIGEVPVRGALVLAPLAGYNDQPFRRLCRRMGAALVYTGLLSARTLCSGTPYSEDLLRFHPASRPLVCQLYGSDPETLARAARRIASRPFDVLDVNLGCAKYKITRRGAGAALLRDPAKVGRIVARLTRAVPQPVTGKIRLGWDQHARNYLEVARALEENGAALIAVHGRTAVQGFRGRADWDAIAEVKAAVRVPVLASGDVRTGDDIARMQAHTGCDGVMIGRGAIGHPWIFQRRDRGDVPWSERLPVIEAHLRAMVDVHGAYHGLRRFRKHLQGYLRGSGIPRRERPRFLRCNDVDALLALLEQAV